MLQATEKLGNGFCLGDLEVRPRHGLIRRSNGTVHVEPKVMNVLLVLAERAGEVVTRDELIERVWNGSPVADEPLTRCISSLRRYLDDSPRKPRFLETIPKRGYRLMLSIESAGTIEPFPANRRRSADRTPTNSIAVLPFVNLSGDASQDSLADGLSAGITNTLARSAGLAVVSRTSAFCFKSRHADVRSIGRRLATRTLLEGTVHRSGDRVQITVALIDARSGYQRWA
ncbi:MAG: winged helix-turn-helix domain-containing protein, partial [Gammaproteobacteria bacterium]|nr:winged helix-turn-helix domain-containing protein [Gammaproteobacteria bacterium]